MAFSTFSIRFGLDSDFFSFDKIETACDAQFPAGRLPGVPGSDNVSHAEFEAGIADKLLWAVDIGRDVTGFALAQTCNRVIHLRQIAILPEYQRQGVGRALMNRVFREAEQRNISELTLTTFEDIPWNAPWYRSLGFRILDIDACHGFLRDHLEAERAAGMIRRVAMVREI